MSFIALGIYALILPSLDYRHELRSLRESRYVYHDHTSHTFVVATLLALVGAVAFIGILFQVYEPIEEHIMAEAHLTVIDSPHTADQTRERLRAALTASGNTIFADIDQSAAATTAGLTLRPTWLIVFGNPKAGTGLMQRHPLAAYELPLKFLVWHDGERTRIAYRKPSDIGVMFGITDLSEQLTTMDAGIAKIIESALEASPTSV